MAWILYSGFLIPTKCIHVSEVGRENSLILFGFDLAKIKNRSYKLFLTVANMENPDESDNISLEEFVLKYP